MRQRKINKSQFWISGVYTIVGHIRQFSAAERRTYELAAPESEFIRRFFFT